MKFLNLFSLPVWLTALTVISANAETPQGTTITPVIVEAQSYHRDFRENAFENPASRFYKQDYSLSTIGFRGQHEDANDFKVAQMGKGNSFWKFEAESQYILDKNNLVWGEASYTNGKRHDVTWNETSDFELLYPYVMGDEYVGSLKYEQYYLNGGYAGRYKQWIFGATIGYRALCEFRTHDPRPNNTVADLKASIAAGLNLGKYNLALSFKAGKYKQTNDLKYFNELGAKKEYHLTGIGNEFVRFSGACNNVFYKGHNLGGSFEFIPTDREGISASLMYNYFTFDKILSNLNKLPLNKVKENEIGGEVAWMKQNSKKAFYGVKFNANYIHRDGYDNMFGDATNNVYPQIGSTLMFKNRRTNATFSGFYEQTVNGCFPIGIKPFVSYMKYTSSHAVSYNEFNTDNLLFGTSLKGSFIKKRNMFQLSLSASHRLSTTTELNIDKETECSPSLTSIMNHTAEYFDKSETNTNITLRYQFKLRPKTMSFFIEASWGHRFYLRNQHDNHYMLTTGVCL